MGEKVTFDKEKWMYKDKDGNMHQGAPGTESKIRFNSTAYNESTIQKQLVHEEVNTAYNHHIIVDRIKKGIARDLCDEPKAKKGTPFICVGSGPSLDHSIKFLKDWKGGIFCSTSHALSLMRYGIEPTHIVVLDPFCTWDEIKGVDWSKTKTKLVTHPGAWPDLIENWPNEILLYLQHSGRPNSFYQNTQKRMYTWREDQGKGIRDPIFHYYIRTELVIFACSPPMQLFVADHLGYDAGFLCGCDFGFSEELDRFTDYTVDETGMDINENGEMIPRWIEHKHPFIPNERTIIANNGVPSEEIHMYYKKNFLSAWRLSLKTLYTTDHGTITEIPFADIEKVIRVYKNGKKFPKQSWDFIKQRADMYLGSVDTFIIESSGGCSFIEAPDHQEECITNFMLGMQKQFECGTCHARASAPDNVDHTGDKCTCGGTIKRCLEVDIEANLKRLRRYITVHENMNEIKILGGGPIPQKTDEECVKLITESTKGTNDEAH